MLMYDVRRKSILRYLGGKADGCVVISDSHRTSELSAYLLLSTGIHRVPSKPVPGVHAPAAGPDGTLIRWYSAEEG